MNLSLKNLFQEISFTLLPGAITLLSGKNGSGKTSFLRMIAGVINLEKGSEILINDIPLREITKPYVNFVGHEFAIKNQLSVLENIEFWAKCYDSEILIPAALNYFGLTEIYDQKCSELSVGNKKKVALARLMSCKSDLWLLDEVETNLDEENKTLLYNLINIKANNGGIIIIASHNDLPFENAVKIRLE